MYNIVFGCIPNSVQFIQEGFTETFFFVKVFYHSFAKFYSFFIFFPFFYHSYFVEFFACVEPDSLEPTAHRSLIRVASCSHAGTGPIAYHFRSAATNADVRLAGLA